MFSNAGSLLDRLQGLLSKGFLLGGLVPLVFLFFINWGLVFYFYPETAQQLSTVFLPAKDAGIWYWSKVILVLVVGGIVFWSFNPWFRQLLEGRFLPKKVRSWLSSQQGSRFSRLEEEKEAQGRELQNLRDHVLLWKKELAAAQEMGNKKKIKQPESPELLKEFKSLSKLHQSFDIVPFTEMQTFLLSLKKELEDKGTSGNELNRIQVGFVKMAKEAWMQRENNFNKLITEIEQRFPDNFGRVGPTSMANFAEVHRDYGISRFGLDIEHFWIRLLKVIRGDADFYPMLEEAKNQLDFSVALVLVLGITTTIWIPFSFLADGVWPFLLVGFLGPVATSIAYHVAVQSYRGFSEVVRSAIDLNRFKLLELLHVTLPANSEEEKELWKKLARGKVICYKNNPAEAATVPKPPAPSGFLHQVKKIFG